jgi:hypothetical protein
VKVEPNAIADTNDHPFRNEIVEFAINCRYFRNDTNGPLGRHLTQVQRATKIVDSVRLLPRKALVTPSEVSVGRSLLVRRTTQVQVTNNRCGAEVKDIAHDLGNLGVVDRLGTKRLNKN